MLKCSPFCKIHNVLTAGILLFILFTFNITGCSSGLIQEVGLEDPQAEEEMEQHEEVDPDALKEQERLQREKEEREERERQERILEERRLREEALKDELGPFFVPLPPLEKEDNPPVKARGIYVTGNTVGLTSRFEDLLHMVETTELNAMVIDVKNDHGVMSYRSDIEIVSEAGANRNVPVKDMQEVISRLKDKGIYTIARIVVFRDPLLPEFKPEWAIQRNQGGVWRTRGGVAWVNPYDKQVWDYNIAIAKEAALVGFQEIQFDYVRFPENAHRLDQEAYYPGEDGMPKDQAIENFLIYAGEQLEKYNVHLSADVFGVIATSWGDTDRIGQTWEKIAPQVDYNCPMIYPSHYGPGYFGFSVPDANPSGTVRNALIDAIKRNAPIENPGIIRPWLQSFTASWVRGHIPYGTEEVREQIETALELGIDEYLIWNARNNYFSDAFLSEEEARQLRKDLQAEREKKGHDVLGNTAEDALKEYLEAVQKRNWREALVYQSTDFTMDHKQFREWVGKWTGRLTSYEMITKDLDSDNSQFVLDVVITNNQEELKLNNQKFEVFIENSIWRVKPPEDFTEMLTFVVEDSQENN